MNLTPELISKELYEVASFDVHNSRPRERVTLVVLVRGKHQTMDFVLVNYQVPYSGILGKDWTVPMDVTLLKRYQYIKFPHEDKVAKVKRNQMVTY